MGRVRGRPALVGLAAVAAVAWPFFTSKTIHFYGALSAIYALVALSLVILAGWTGQVSLGHAAFLGFGVYIGQKVLSAGVPVLLAVAGSLGVGVVFSLAQGYVKTPGFAELVVFVALLAILLLRHQRQAALETVPEF